MTTAPVPRGNIINTIASVIGANRYDCTDEYRMQDGIAQALTAAVITHEREFILSTNDRIDFMAGDIGIECKVDGSAVPVARQLFRYLAQPRVAGLILVTSRARLGLGLPHEFCTGGVTKPLVVVELWRTAL